MQSKIRFIALFVLVFGMMIASTSAQEAINVGDTVEATASGAEVEYSLKLSEGQPVLIDIVSDFSSTLIIRDDAGEVVGGGESGTGASWNDTRAVFIAPAEGTYTVVVAARFGTPSGNYSLSIAEQEVGMLTVGETFTATDATGKVFVYHAFEASEGDVVNIFANAFSDDDDLKITLFDSLGAEVTNDDDSGQRFNPYVRRQILPADGTYVIFLERTFDNAMVGNYEITVEATEALDLAGGEFSVTLGEELGTESFVFEAVSGTVYTLNLAASANGAASIEIYGPGSDFYDHRFDGDTFLGATFSFRAPTSGLTVVKMRHRGFSGSVDYTVSLSQ